jgi:hypothetical protein
VDWQLQSDQGFLDSKRWRAELDPRAPNSGLQVRFETMQLGQFFKISPKPSHSFAIQEAYVRQNDLIVRYEQSNQDLYTVQLNWRRLESEIPDALAVEVWISVQTSLLDTHPTIEVRSRTPDAQWHVLTLSDLQIEKNDCAVLGLVKKSGVTSIIMIEPSDAQQARRITERSDEFSFRILGDFMEKGVIRRARLRLLVVTAELSRSKIIKEFRAFTDSPLPLTA